MWCMVWYMVWSKGWYKVWSKVWYMVWCMVWCMASDTDTGTNSLCYTILLLTDWLSSYTDCWDTGWGAIYLWLHSIHSLIIDCHNTIITSNRINTVLVFDLILLHKILNHYHDVPKGNITFDDCDSIQLHTSTLIVLTCPSPTLLSVSHSMTMMIHVHRWLTVDEWNND